MDYGILCSVNSIIAHSVLIASVPFHPVRLIGFNKCIATSPIILKGDSSVRSDCT